MLRGVHLKLWEKSGYVADIGVLDVLFRDSRDYGNPGIKVSNDWWVWKVNEPFKNVGKLEGENQKAEIGVVIAPESILYRMRTGKYDFIYPDFKI